MALELHHNLFVLDANLVRPLSNLTGSRMSAQIVGQLLMALNMQRLCTFRFYKATDLRAPGFSFFQPITTSHISGHYFKIRGEDPHIHLDIYSCKPFDWKLIMPLLNTHLNFREWSANYICRSVSGIRNYCEIRGKNKNILSEICLAGKK